LSSLKLNVDPLLNAFCIELARDPLVVQGAGGNVSIKDSNTMWIKASGTSLAHAEVKNIFVPVDLLSMREDFSNNYFTFTPKVLDDSKLRPSIETHLHGLMKHKVVIHLHLISALVQLVKKDAQEIISQLIGNSISWGYVDYCKPGIDLALAVARLLTSNEAIDVIFLGNHGIVMGADSLQQAADKLRRLDHLMERDALVDAQLNKVNKISTEVPIHGFHWATNRSLHALAQNEVTFKMVRDSWALFPDHVVFLGDKARSVDNIGDLLKISQNRLEKDPFIFIKGLGVLQNNHLNSTQLEQLICYSHVVSNLGSNDSLRCLSEEEIDALLNWDAEIYRQSISE